MPRLPSWLLIVIGLTGCVAAAMVVWWPPVSQSGTGSPQDLDDALSHEEGRSDPATAAGAGAVTLQPIIAADALIEQVASAVAPLDAIAASGRDPSALLPRSLPPGAGDPAGQSPANTLALPSLPAQGRAALLVRSTLGGMEAQRHLRVSWRCQEPTAVVFQGLPGQAPDRSVSVQLERGIWTCTADDLDQVLTSSLADLARVIAAAKQAWSQPQTLTASASLQLAGEAVTVWSLDPAQALLVSADDHGAIPEHYPPSPGAWNDWRLHLTPTGSWHALERLIASPSTPEAPGFLVRRVVVEWR